MDFDNLAQVRDLARLPVEPPPKPERGLWATAAASLIGAAAKVQAGAIEVGNVVGPALVLANDPTNDKALEAVKQAPDFGQTDVSKPFRDFERGLRPDPATAGTAEKVVYGAVGPLAELVGAAVLGGPVGLGVASAEQGFSVAEDLRQQGVDLRTRTAVGGVQAVVTGASAALPMMGSTLARTAALYAAGGPGGFVAQQVATRAILESADYHALALQYDPLDPVGLAMSALIPAPFAAWGAMRNIRAKPAPRVADGAPAADPVPGEVEVAPAPAVAPEAVDAAMVHNLTLARDRADAVAAIPRAETLPPPERVIEQRLAEKVAGDFDAAVAEYATRKDAMGGKVLNTDTARELSPDYLADRTKSAAVHEPASWFIKRLYARKLAEIAPGDKVMFSSGGTGAGKTSAINQLGLAEDAAIVYDTNMNTLGSAVTKIEQALEAGADVSIVHVQRDPVESLVQGALTRAMRQEREYGSGRTVPLEEHAKTHRGAAEVLQQLAERYKDNPRVKISVIDNTHGKDGAVVSDLGFVRGFDYTGVEGKLHAALIEERNAGRISANVFRATEGAAARGLVRPDGTSDGGQPQSERAQGLQGPAGASAEVVTERGLTAPVQYRLVEAEALVTSHSNDLNMNPAFPAGLQPRDRTRADSAAQIARIENKIDPALLGESRKASDGAPIVGPDGVVESGNARTIALRRAYDSGKADGYRAWLAGNAERFGLTANDVRGMYRPVLVRERLGTIDRAEFARQANESPIAAMSAVETARADASRMVDLSGLVANDDGTISMARSGPFLRQFMQGVPPTERGALMQAGGELSQAGVQRIRNAVFARAYGDTSMLAALTESTDSNVRNILAGMLRAAPDVARLRDLIEAGAREPIDIAPDLAKAVQTFSKLRADGMTVAQYRAQGSLIDGPMAPELDAMLQGLSDNARAPKRIAEMIRGMVDAVDALGDPRQADMLGGDKPKAADVATNAVERMKALTDEQISGIEPETIAVKVDPLVQSVSDRVRALEIVEPDLPVGEGQTLAQFMADARKAANDGDGANLGILDADLVRVAAECALATAA